MTSNVIIETFKPRDLSNDQITKLKRLTLRNGMMRGALDRCILNGDGHVTTARIDDMYVSWGLRFKIPYYPTKNNWGLYVYTKQSHRRQGIGTKVIARSIRSVRPNIPVYCYPHDDTSHGFWTVNAVRYPKVKGARMPANEGR